MNDLFAQMNPVIVPGPFCDSLIRLPILLTGRDYKDNEEWGMNRAGSFKEEVSFIVDIYLYRILNIPGMYLIGICVF